MLDLSGDSSLAGPDRNGFQNQSQGTHGWKDFKSIQEFGRLQERLGGPNPNVPTIVIPAGTCGQASGANDLIRIAKRELLG